MHMSSCEVNAGTYSWGRASHITVVLPLLGCKEWIIQAEDWQTPLETNKTSCWRIWFWGDKKSPQLPTFLVYENMQLSNFLLKMPFWGGYIIGKIGHTQNKETRKRKGLQQTMPCDEAHFQACHVWWNFLEVVSTMSDGTHQSMASYRWKVGQQQSGGIRDWGWHGKIRKKWDQDSISVDVVVFLLMSNDLDFHFHSTSFGFLFAVILSWFVQGQWLDVPNALWHGCWISRLLCDWRTPIVDWLDVLKLRMFCTHECC